MNFQKITVFFISVFCYVGNTWYNSIHLGGFYKPRKKIRVYSERT